jgi:uncharacterized protein Veg
MTSIPQIKAVLGEEVGVGYREGRKREKVISVSEIEQLRASLSS